MVKVYGYTKCSTVKKSLKFLEANDIDFEFIDFVENKLGVEEIKTIYCASALPLKRMFNTSGILYREMQLKDRLPEMNEDEQLQLLATDGMLIKRPIIVSDKGVGIGFKENEWINLI